MPQGTGSPRMRLMAQSHSRCGGGINGENSRKTVLVPLQDFATGPGEDGIMCHEPRMPQHNPRGGALQNQETDILL